MCHISFRMGRNNKNSLYEDSSQAVERLSVSLFFPQVSVARIHPLLQQPSGLSDGFEGDMPKPVLLPISFKTPESTASPYPPR